MLDARQLSLEIDRRINGGAIAPLSSVYPEFNSGLIQTMRRSIVRHDGCICIYLI